MLNHPIFILALVVIAAGFLAFWFFSGVGLLFLIAFVGNGGKILDLYRIRRFVKHPVDHPDPGISRTPLHRQAGQLARQSASPSEPITDQEPDNADDLALTLAASID